MYKNFCLLAVLAVVAAAPSIAFGESTVWSSQNYNAAWDKYNRKYGFASDALRRAFPGNDSAIAGKQVQNKQTGWGVEPPRVVLHAQSVDQPVRALRENRLDGQTFINYLTKPDVHNWYQANFGLR